MAFASCIFAFQNAHAERLPQGGRLDGRIRTVTYKIDDVVAIKAAYGISTMVLFGDDETIETITLGDTVSWQVIPNSKKNILFLKPVEPNAVSNMNVVTNRHVYSFALNSTDSEAKKDHTFSVQFKYPDDDIDKKLWDKAREAVASPNISNIDIANTNLDYAYKGSDSSKPLVAFDDGKKTFLKFGGAIPSIFAVGTDRREKVINYRREKDYIVLDGVYSQLSLRRGRQVTCLFNLKPTRNHVLQSNEAIATPKKIPGKVGR
ncbi:P-type conjugative transfer protein VirB9 [Bartonella choladocola]|uniref:P-type conjugative transfer protein VirB9 n=1 Tax=Bartonella choladocola TaxID=2750995 RepID=UPI00166284C5